MKPFDKKGKLLGLEWSIYHSRSTMVQAVCGPIGLCAYRRAMEAHFELSYHDLYFILHRSPVRTGIYFQRWSNHAAAHLRRVGRRLLPSVPCRGSR